MVDLIFSEFPWMKHLPTDDRAEFVSELAEARHAAAEAEDWSMLNQLILEWRDAALIHTDPELVDALTGPLDGDYGPVPRPHLIL